MARELIEVNPNDEPAVLSRDRNDRGRETYVRSSAGYREERSARSSDSAESTSNYLCKNAERGRKRTQSSDELDDAVLVDLEQEEEEQFLRASRRVPVRRNALPKKLAQKVKLAAVVVGVAGVLFGMAATAYGYGLHSWRFRISSSDNIELFGVHNASRAHVMEVAGADIGRNIFFVPLDDRKRQLEQIPWVESASIMRLLPNRIAVDIQERTPVAFAQIGPRISLIDANGVIMGMPANRRSKYSFPVIRGISDTEPLSSRAAAMKIYNRMAAELDSGGDNGACYTRQLSEVDLSDPEDVKVTANEGGGTLLIHLGSSNFLDRYKLYLAHIVEWRQQFQNLQSVDLRYEGQIVVNPDKQEQPPANRAEQSAFSGQHSDPQANSRGPVSRANRWHPKKKNWKRKQS
jgi:cell division protein FtsQ